MIHKYHTYFMITYDITNLVYINKVKVLDTVFFYEISFVSRSHFVWNSFIFDTFIQFFHLHIWTLPQLHLSLNL